MRKLALLSRGIGALFVIIVAISLPANLIAKSTYQDTVPSPQADRLFSEGWNLLMVGKFQEALPKLEAALPLFEIEGSKRDRARCLLAIGVAKMQLSNYDGAVVALESSLALWIVENDPEGQEITLSNLGSVYRVLGKLPEAEKAHRRTLELAKEQGERENEGSTHNNIAFVYQDMGRHQEALAEFKLALSILEQTDDVLRVAITYSNIGLSYNAIGDYQNAQISHHRALELVKDMVEHNLTPSLLVDYRALEASIRNNIAITDHNLGRVEDALENYELSLSALKEVGDPRRVGITYQNMASLYSQQGRLEMALNAYMQALERLDKANAQRDKGAVASGIAGVFLKLKQFEEALEMYQEAYKIFERIGDRNGIGNVLDNMGSVYRAMNRYSEALTVQKQALSILRESAATDDLATAIFRMGQWHEEMKQSDLAIAYYEESIKVSESILDDIHVEEFKTSLAAKHTNQYQRLINLLWQKSLVAATPTEYALLAKQAFVYVEHAKAQAFLEQMGNHGLNSVRLIPDGLVKEEQDLRNTIYGIMAALKEARKASTGQLDQSLIDSLGNALEQAQKQYAQFFVRLKLSNSIYASLFNVSTLSLEEVQKRLLDDQSTLIEYFVMDGYTLAWVIDQEGFQVVDLNITSKELEAKIRYFQDGLTSEKGKEFDQALASELYQILFASLRQHVKHTNLIIVPHSILHYLPFAALWEAKTKHYLVQDFAITYTPSASVLTYVINKQEPSQGHLLAMGDPDGSLPHAETEVKAVADLFNTQPLVRSTATESEVYTQANRIDILHLAAHGVYVPTNPLYTRIELAPDSINDGNLEVHEVYGLNLTNINLVVLSACQTGLSQPSKGDELVGLTRAFLYAGTPAVVTTLWSINDAASSTLMVAFYRHLQEGLGNAEALRAAQLEVMAQIKWDSPYYWAAFTLTGDAMGGNDH